MLSRNTVRKYLRIDEQAIQAALEASQRRKTLDTYRTYLIGLLIQHSNLKTPKVLRKHKAKVPDLDISERTLRRYLQRIKPLVAAAQPRYYEPVIYEVPGVQSQADGGELLGRLCYRTLGKRDKGTVRHSDGWRSGQFR